MGQKISPILIASAIGSVLSLAGRAEAAPLVQCAEQERCYGVVKAGRNDCSTATTACPGSAKQDSQKDAWLYLPKGTCAKITGASLTPGTPPAKK